VAKVTQMLENLTTGGQGRMYLKNGAGGVAAVEFMVQFNIRPHY